jgi:RNA polymerase sigma-70 factor (ECF subfamily)
VVGVTVKVRRDFEELFRAEYRGLVRALVPLTGDRGDAEAVVQDAFVKALVRWERIRRYDRPGAWVRRVAIRDAVRADRRARAAPPPTAADPDDDPLDHVPQQVDLHRAIQTLPGRQRAAVVLHHLAGWPAAEVADALGCAESTVRVHLHRGRQALALALHLTPEMPEEAHDEAR